MRFESNTGVIVVCHSGHTYAERPQAFKVAEERFEVAKLAAEWQTPERKHFRVVTKCGREFELVYDLGGDQWEAFDRAR